MWPRLLASVSVGRRAGQRGGAGVVQHLAHLKLGVVRGAGAEEGLQLKGGDHVHRGLAGYADNRLERRDGTGAARCRSRAAGRRDGSRSAGDDLVRAEGTRRCGMSMTVTSTPFVSREVIGGPHPVWPPFSEWGRHSGTGSWFVQ